MKKSFLYLIFTLSLLMIISVGAIGISAANTSSSTAHDFGTLQSGSVYSESGSVAVSGRDYWYKFTVEAAGELTIKLEHEIITSTDSYWNFVCYQADATTYLTGASSSVPYWKSAGNESKTVVDGIFLEAGTYYIRVTSGKKYSDATYTLSLSYTHDNRTETEYNSSYATADELVLNEAYRGSLTASTDEDWFCFTTDTDGYFSITFDHDITTSKEKTWRIYVYHEDGTSYICDETNYWSVTDNEASVQTPKFGVSAGKYYIKIVNNTEHSDTTYTFTVNFTEADNWEKESNHTYLLANDMGTSKLWYGTTATSSYNSDETDWFKINVTYTASYKLTFSHAQVGGASDNVWSVALYKADGTTRLTSANVKGGSDLELDLGELTAGTYYVKVMANLYHSSEVYSIAISDDHAHNYSAVGTQYSSTQHIQECTLCGETAYLAHDWNSGTVTDHPTCTDTGEKLYKCTICSEEKTEELPAEHKIVTVDGKEATCTEEGYTKHVYCRVCEVVFEQSEPISALGHLESDWINKGEVSCTDGVDRYKECIRCHTVLDEDHVEGVGHVFDNVYGVAPTCETYGYTYYGCVKCGYSYEDDIKEALGHLESDWINRIEPSCTVGVDRYKECLRCSAVLVEEQADPIGHVFDAHVVEPTCTEQGYIRDVCVECGYSYESETIPATGKHNFGEPTEVNGYIVTVCRDCGHSVSTIAPKLEEVGGCQSSFGVSAVLVAIVSVAGSLIFRKKED
ncbi:MAG: hypothetical protein E7592_03725 [Ruminococcaceae bacterium]|nr:hypothetical protein [Oscillospiraceae bacterium]